MTPWSVKRVGFVSGARSRPLHRGAGAPFAEAALPTSPLPPLPDPPRYRARIGGHESEGGAQGE